MAGTTTGNGIAGKRIVLGVSGGIAAYKAAEIASTLVQAGATVDVILTHAATEFIAPLTFEGITHRAVRSGVFEGWEDGHTGHVELAASADLLLISPATANTIARLALGLVDDMLSAVALATAAPILVAPAMETHMWNHPATQGHIATLGARGVSFIGPATGRLASGASGVGRLAPPAEIVAAAVAILDPAPRSLSGRTIVVTAGGTQEALDPVRYLGNRSSGLMGVEIARAAAAEGADVRLIATSSVSRDLVNGLPDVTWVQSARDLEEAVQAAIIDADALVMAAAVADFRPAEFATSKIKKQPGQDRLVLELVRNPDILAGIEQPGLLKIGFAAETDDLEANARKKLASKGLAMIVANDANATIGQATSEATLYLATGESVALPRADKALVAGRIVAEMTRLLGSVPKDD